MKKKDLRYLEALLQSEIGNVITPEMIVYIMGELAKNPSTGDGSLPAHNKE